MKPSSFEKLKNLSQCISDNTTGVRATHLGNNIHRPVNSGIDEFNTAVRSIDKFKPRTVIESFDLNRGNYAYDLSNVIRFLPFLKQLHQQRKDTLNKVTVKDASQDSYAGIIPSYGNPVDGDIGINDVRIDGKNGAPFLEQFHSIVKSAALEQYSPVEVDALMKSLLGFINHNNITTEGSLLHLIKSHYDTNKSHAPVNAKDLKYTDIQLYVGRVLKKVLCGSNPAELSTGYESFIGWAADEVLPRMMPVDSSATGNDPNIVTKSDVIEACIKEFQSGGSSPDNIEVLQRLYCDSHK